MRINKINITRYGAFEERKLSIPDSTGLTIIYGPNEAGKSTSLFAISDFFYGIPSKSPHGSYFGYDGMAISLQIDSSDGKILNLQRRKGRTKTLRDETGEPVEDAILSAMLGSVSRDKFHNLFGLNHESLREGGESLLQADGDIGRLIVEAGGGLQSLMERLDQLNLEAENLYADRKSGKREFYNALDEFKHAEREAKSKTVSRVEFDKTSNKIITVDSELSKLRLRKSLFDKEISALERSIRTVPQLKKLDNLTEELGTFSEIEHLADDFHLTADEMLSNIKSNSSRLAEELEEKEFLSDQLSKLTVSELYVEHDAKIRDVKESAAVVRSARHDKPKRERELDDAKLGLLKLKDLLSAGSDFDPVQNMPEQSALTLVQELGAKGIALESDVNTAEESFHEIEDQISALKQKIDLAQTKGFKKPLSFETSHFSDLSSKLAITESKEKQVELELNVLQEKCDSLGLSSLEELVAINCPSTEIVLREQSDQEKLVAEIKRFKQDALDVDAKIAKLKAEVEGIELRETIATNDLIEEIRGKRDTAWKAIRDQYVDDDIPDVVSQRLERIEAFEQNLTASDRVSERISQDAQRAADLAADRKSIKLYEIDKNTFNQKQEVAQNSLDQRREKFLEGFTEITEKLATLPKLANFVEQRDEILNELELVHMRKTHLLNDRVELDKKLSNLDIVCKEAGLKTDGRTNLGSIISELKQYEAGYSDYALNLRDLEALEPKFERVKSRFAKFGEKREKWREDWVHALEKIGAPADLNQSLATDLISEWVRAKATYQIIDQIQGRLDGMERDEKKLEQETKNLGQLLELSLPEDGLASADLILEKWEEQNNIRIKRETLEPGFVTLSSKCESMSQKLAELEAAKNEFCNNYNIKSDEESLRKQIQKSKERSDIRNKISTVTDTLSNISDGFTIAELRQEWDGNDIDSLRGALGVKKDEKAAVDEEIEFSIRGRMDLEHEIGGLSDENDLNEAVAKRESAATRMQRAINRYLELVLARELVNNAVDKIRKEQQDPLLMRAGELFVSTTQGKFKCINTDIDEDGKPIVVGVRESGKQVLVSQMSDGTRDQLFLSFRLASLEKYSASAEPLPFIADDILVHFDDERSEATLDLLAEYGKSNQVLLFTHHLSVREKAAKLEKDGLASIVDLVGS